LFAHHKLSLSMAEGAEEVMRAAGAVAVVSTAAPVEAAAFMAVAALAAVAVASGAKADITAGQDRCMGDREEGCLEGFLEDDREAWAADRRLLARSTAPLMGAPIPRLDGIRWADLRRDIRHQEDPAAWPVHPERAAEWKAMERPQCMPQWLTVSGTRLEAPTQHSRRD
jgi:hypothetical protein